MRNYAAFRGAWGVTNPKEASLRKELPHAADGGPEGILIYFHEVDKGGHFAAWEQPELLYEELRAAFRSLREPEQGTGVGHNLPQESPQAFAEAVVEVDSY